MLYLYFKRFTTLRTLKVEENGNYKCHYKVMFKKVQSNKSLGNINTIWVMPKFKGLSETMEVQANFAETLLQT